MPKKIVHKVEPEMNRGDIYCTTYQMRSFYRQLGDGFFTNLDVMNYIQHHRAAMMIRKGWNVLDVCCGRSLMLPLIRYHAKDIGEYVGVDISEKNLNEAQTRCPTGKDIDHRERYPFRHSWVQADVAEMSKHLQANHFDLVIYTSAIEHMTKDAGAQSLRECRAVAKPGATLFLSSPNTSGGQETQYAAHLYEWPMSELQAEAQRSGWRVDEVVGLVANIRDIERMIAVQPALRKAYEAQAKHLPREWLTALWGIPFPQIAKEVLWVCKAT